jgi:hypothetical protein
MNYFIHVVGYQLFTYHCNMKLYFNCLNKIEYFTACRAHSGSLFGDSS